MKFVRCNCLTKTPVPYYHKENCPVYLKDRVLKLQKLVKLLADAADNVNQKQFIIQPYLSIWVKYGGLIEECRNAKPETFFIKEDTMSDEIKGKLSKLKGMLGSKKEDISDLTDKLSDAIEETSRNKLSKLSDTLKSMKESSEETIGEIKEKFSKDKYVIDPWNNMCYVFEFPGGECGDEFPKEYCFSPVETTFSMVDWFCPIPIIFQMAVSKEEAHNKGISYQTLELTQEEVERAIVPFVKQKNYVTCGKRYLIVTDFNFSHVFTGINW